MAGKYHLTKMVCIVVPNEFVGWGILDMGTFGSALLIKSLLREINNGSMWRDIIQRKYMRGKDIIFWYRRGTLGQNQVSIISRSLQTLKYIYLQNQIWRFGNEAHIIIGNERIKEVTGTQNLSENLVNCLHARGYIFLYETIGSWQGFTPIWKEAGYLQILVSFRSEWNQYIITLRMAGLCFRNNRDQISWPRTMGPKGIVFTYTYKDIIKTTQGLHPNWFKQAWKPNIPHKITLFNWLVWRYRNLTWENLRKRGLQGPGQPVYVVM